MPIVQISRIQHRRGKRTDLPQLAAGELGWVIDEQRLFIGNGTVADGAPAVGNTEIVTSGSSGFTTALTYTYKGYLGDSTPIIIIWMWDNWFAFTFNVNIYFLVNFHIY